MLSAVAALPALENPHAPAAHALSLRAEESRGGNRAVAAATAGGADKQSASQRGARPPGAGVGIFRPQRHLPPPVARLGAGERGGIDREPAGREQAACVSAGGAIQVMHARKPGEPQRWPSVSAQTSGALQGGCNSSRNVPPPRTARCRGA